MSEIAPSADLARPRTPGSTRRTTTVDVTWPHGAEGPMRFEGIGRDLVTHVDASTTVTDYIEVQVDVDASERRILGLRSSKDDGSPALVGRRLGHEVRQAMEQNMRPELEYGAAVVQLFDDLVGAWIVSGVALTNWNVFVAGPPLRAIGGERKQMAGVCLGFAPGSSGLAQDGGYAERLGTRDVAALVVADDPLAWHAMPDKQEMSMRRARRIDVVFGPQIEIYSMFQDSSTMPAGGRVGIHQYGVAARASRTSLELTSISADPQILPYGECPMAAAGVSSLVGVRLPDLRERVSVELSGVRGCTHLNDAVRALSSAAQLAERALAAPKGV